MIPFHFNIFWSNTGYTSGFNSFLEHTSSAMEQHNLDSCIWQTHSSDQTWRFHLFLYVAALSVGFQFARNYLFCTVYNFGINVQWFQFVIVVWVKYPKSFLKTTWHFFWDKKGIYLFLIRMPSVHKHCKRTLHKQIYHQFSQHYCCLQTYNGVFEDNRF